MKHTEKAQYEIKKDDSGRFAGSIYISKGYSAHFHRNVEIYGVVKGKVRVKIAGEEKVLTDGQMAIVNCMELHSYTAEDNAEVFFLHIGSRYLSTYYSLYQRRFLPRWLLDVQKNESLLPQILKILRISRGLTELKKHGVATCLLADIVERYGVREEGQEDKEYDFIEEVVAYIGEHYAEEITLKSLAAQFCIEEKTLSKKLSRCIGVDLRVFVNDIRAQAAMLLRNDPAMKDVPLKEIGRRCGFKNQDTFYRVYRRNISGGDLSR